MMSLQSGVTPSYLKLLEDAVKKCRHNFFADVKAMTCQSVLVVLFCWPRSAKGQVTCYNFIIVCTVVFYVCVIFLL